MKQMSVHILNKEEKGEKALCLDLNSSTDQLQSP